jgi:hypothetical protein
VFDDVVDRDHRRVLERIDVQFAGVDGTCKVTLPHDSGVWNVFQGVNTKTKTLDVFVSFKDGPDGYTMYRLSGKHRQWVYHWGLRGKTPTAHLKGYEKAQNVKKLEPIRKNGCPVACAAPPVATKPTADCCGHCKQEGRRPIMGGSLSKVFGRFGKCEKGQFSLTIEGGVAIRRNDADYACLKDGVLVNIETLKIDLEAFYYLPVSPDKLKAGDVVVIGKGVGFVQKVGGNDISVYDVNNEAVSVIKPIQHFLMPTPFVTKVVNLMGECAGGGMNPLMFLMLADKGGNMDKLLPLMLMAQAQGGQGQVNPLLMALVLGKGDGDLSKMLPLMLLMQGQGQAPANPMLLAMMLGGTDGMEDMLPLMLMGGMGGAGLGNLFGGCAAGGCAAPAKPAKKNGNGG